MGAGTEDQDRKDSTKGFAGLSSLVSNVDTTISEALRNAEAVPHAVKREVTPTAASQTSPSTAKPPSAYRPPPQPTSGASTWKWIIGIAVAVGLIWVISRSDERPQNTAPTYRPVTPSLPAPAATPTRPSPAPTTQQTRRPTEEQPPVGDGLTHTMPQLRYCAAENIRLDAAKTVINSYSDIDVDRFNGLVTDYNSRCGQFRYKTGTLESARSDVEQYRTEIEAEGRARFSRAPVPVSTADMPIEAQVVGLDTTVQSIQGRLNKLGYNSGEADGLLGDITRAAILAFQRDQNVVEDGKPSRELLNLLTEQTPPVQSTATSRVSPSLKPPSALNPKQDAPRQSGMPANAELDYTGKDWTCKRSFKQVGTSCQAVELPANAELDYTGKDWTCKRSFKQVGTSCQAVELPANAELDYTGKDWTCKRSFKQVGTSCQAVELPANAELDYTGKDWTCKRGFKQVGTGCSFI